MSVDALPESGRSQAAVGELVRRYRLRLRMAQQDLAARSGVSLRSVRDIELGRVHCPRPASLARLAEALGLTEAERTELHNAYRARPDRDRLRVGVLGPLVLHRDGRPAPLGPPTRRTLLGLLALQCNQFVSIEEIIDTLWGDAPPRTCKTQVQTAVGQLRALTGSAAPGGTALLRSVRGGYLLRLDEEDIDALRFTRLAEQACGAAGNGDPAAVGLFDQAMRCWRGPVVADAPERLRGHPAAVALSRRRVEAVLRLAEVAAATGRDEQAVGWLQTLAAAEPLHEALHARLMLALARRGDRAAAIRVYRDLRSRLVNELGIEPGAELRQAQQAVLASGSRPGHVGGGHHHGRTADPAATSAPAPGDAGGWAPGDQLSQVPRQLPAATAVLVGRGRLLVRLRRELARPRPPGRPAVLAIHGPAGVGKSALALRLAHDLAAEFPDGQLYLDLQGASPGLVPLAPETALTRLLVGLGSPPSRLAGGLADLAECFRSVTAGRRLLILLDNAVDAGQVAQILPASAGCVVIVTSRTVLASLDVTEHVPVAPLSTADSVRVLSRLAGPERVATESASAVDIVRMCENLPLALRVVGGRLAAHPEVPLAHVAGRLADERRRLDLLELPELSLRATLRVSYDQLTNSARTRDRQAARAFRLVAALGLPSFGVDTVAALLDVAVPDAELVAERLSERGLLEVARPGRLRMHDLLRAVGAELAGDDESPNGLSSAIGRAVDYYVASVWRAGELVRPSVLPPTPRPGARHVADFVDAAEAVGWLERELPDLLVIARRYAPDAAVDLLRGLSPYLPPAGHWDSFAELSRTALNTATARHDQRARSLALTALGLARHRQGDVDAALRHIGAALEIRQEIGDVAAEGTSLDQLGFLYFETGRHAAAIACWARALRLHRQTGRVLPRGTTLHNLGEAYAALGRLAAAERFVRRSLPLRSQAADRYGIARTYVVLGRIRAMRGDLADGRCWLERGIAEARAVRYAEVECEGHICLAKVAVREGRPADALDLLRSADRLACEVGRPYLRWIVLCQLREVQLCLGDVASATSSAVAARQIPVTGAGRDPALEAFLGHRTDGDRTDRYPSVPEPPLAPMPGAQR